MPSIPAQCRRPPFCPSRPPQCLPTPPSLDPTPATVCSYAPSTPQMSSNSGFTVMYSSSIYLCFGCELDLASTAQLIFRFTRSSSIISLMRNSIGHMECEDFGSVLGILIQDKLCVEFWLYFYEYLEDMHLYRIMLEIL
ncbi:uncharacterized protein LOC121994898 [Zingiber officinale]|uniref:uncharacterized protein LOC121994898 n=1 Tax=Zingiber officinale TaxID=94328 RepID=UPI001C4DC1E2|nr:uncharacterized protein LOC121994898 [Zingiber officinale]